MKKNSVVSSVVALTLSASALLSQSGRTQQSIAVDAVIQNQEKSATKIAIPQIMDSNYTGIDAAAALIDIDDTVEVTPYESGTAGEDTVSDNEFYTALTQEQEKDIVDRAYPLMAAKWPFNKVFVCWEEVSEVFFNQRTLVRTAVQETWEAVSDLQFLGWGKCVDNAGGIRIAIEDTGPHVKGLGKFVSGVQNGMILNFTYNNWGEGCQEKMDYCNRVIAIHEFGHAIGFAHEQNRPDTPGECDKRQGNDGDNTSLTPWDKHSVMNYCNPIYGNEGVLSQFDILATQYIYGEAS